MLYWFRTPPGVKVGRTALDDEAMRRIEQLNPDIEFDWPRYLKGGGTPATGAAAADRGGAVTHAAARPPPPRQQPAASRRSRSSRPDHRRRRAIRSAEEDVSDAGRVHAGGGRDAVDCRRIDTPAHAKLGAEGPAADARYAEIRARIAERVTDPTRRDELMAAAERLNPDTWDTDEDGASGSSNAKWCSRRSREVVGRRRRKRRARGPPEDGHPVGGARRWRVAARGVR